MEGLNKYAPLVALKTQALEYANKIVGLKVVDDNSEAIVTQRISEAKDLLKSIEEKRTELKAPFLQAGREIDAIAKALTDDLNKAYDIVRGELKTYKDKKEAEKQAALKALQEIQAKIDNRKALALAAIAKAETKADLSAIFIEHVKGFPADLLAGEFKQDCENVLAEIKRAGSAKLAEITTGVKLLPVTETDEMPQAPRPEPTKLQVAIAETEAKKTQGLVKKWDFELSEILKVPTAWLTLDEKKVDEWMKLALENGNLKDGEVKIINGVKFFQKTELRVK